MKMPDTINLGDQPSNNQSVGRESKAATKVRGQISEMLEQGRWDDLATVRALAAAKSFRDAAAAQQVSVNTLRTRLTRLETGLGTTLFARNRSGLQITPEGRIVLQIADDIRHLSAGLPRGRGNNILIRDGEIRICASEGVGTFWLTPRLMELKEALPDLMVALDCFADQTQLQPDRYDVSISFTRPDDKEAIVSRLCTIHMMPFASKAYIQHHGHPRTLAEASGHRCIQQDAPGLNYALLQNFLGMDATARSVSIRVNSSYSLLWAIASGVGIGALPSYIRTVSKRVLPLDLPINLKFDLWMSYNHAARHSAPVRAAIDWLRKSFDPVRYPWFAEEFIHPDHFEMPFHDSQVVPIFDHIIDGPE
jgi:DNA-binding transcriptional LysR family regulator